MTSNLGSEYILDGKTDMVMTELKQAFRPEFINRIDEIIVFKALTKEVINDILDKVLSEIEERLKDKDIHLVLTDAAREYFVSSGYDVNYGARPLKHLVSRTVESKLARELIQDHISYGQQVVIDYQNQDIVLK